MTIRKTFSNCFGALSLVIMFSMLATPFAYAQSATSTPAVAAPEVIPGCTDADAENYNADATEDDGSCEYPDEEAEETTGTTETVEVTETTTATSSDDGTSESDDETTEIAEQTEEQIETTATSTTSETLEEITTATSTASTTTEQTEEKDTFTDAVEKVVEKVVETVTGSGSDAEETTEESTTSANVTHIETVALGVTYTHVANEQVQVTFTQLPENPGSLTITEVLLTDDQVKQFGAVSNIAYDITSNMENGSFEYDLKLPVPKEKKVAKVVYAESAETLHETSAKEVENGKFIVDESNESVTVNDLNHFTIFIVTSFEEEQTTDPEVGYNGIWFTNGDDIEVEKVPTGTNGITSSVGNYHGEITGPSFTRWDGYKADFPDGGYDTRVDVYLDMSLADGSTDKRFDFSSAINNPSESHRRDFIFHLGTNPSVANQWLVSASNNAPGWPGNPGRSPITLTESGWYTLEHQFRDEAGVLEVTLNIYKKGETTPEGSWVLSDPTDEIGTTVGGNRYGWFTNQRFDFDWLAIDQAEIEYAVPDVMPPTTVFTSPTNGSYVKTTDIAGTITDNENVAQYSFNISGTASWSTKKWTPNTDEVAFDLNLCEEDRLNTCVEGSLADGEYKVRVAAYDGNGNRDISTNVTFILDRTKPVVTLEAPSMTPGVLTGDTEFEISATDNLALNRITGNIYKDGSLFKSNSKTVSGTEASFTFDIDTLPEGTYTLRYNASDKAGNIAQTKTFDFVVDNTPPTITVKPESLGNGVDVFRSVSFKLFDKNKVDKLELNGVEKNLTDNKWSDLNGVVPGKFGAVEGENEMELFDVAGNSTTFTFILDVTDPTVTVKEESVEVGVDTYESVSFKLFDKYKIDKVEINGVEKDLTDNKWSDVNGVVPGKFGAIEGENTMVVYDVAGNTTTVVFTLVIPVDDPYGFITSPETGTTTAGVLALTAEYYDGDEENDDIVQWAVRSGSCSGAANTVAGNVDGFSDSYTWDGNVFGASFDTTTVANGDYCFIFNPKDDGDVDVRETSTFTIDNADEEPETPAEDSDDTETPVVFSATTNDEGGDDSNRAGSHRSSGGSSSGGQVLGASTGVNSCNGMYLNEYIFDGAVNDQGEIALLQVFLVVQGYPVTITGIYDEQTIASVRQYQIDNAEDVLVPWIPFGLDGVTPTNNVYKTTRWKINNTVCDGSEPFPLLP